ncbi:MAG: hypothetical protein ABSF34_15235, partial [Verrucomicrobiota bacterium]
MPILIRRFWVVRDDANDRREFIDANLPDVQVGDFGITVALDAFRSHPEMILKEEDVAVFVANWNDKASNIEHIARVLNLGLDSFVFVDDSAFERELVRSKLPSVQVPEM